MEQITESNWSLGWIPSSDLRGSPNGDSALGFLKMSNLDIDSKGVVRNIKAAKQVSTHIFTEAQSVYSTNFNLDAAHSHIGGWSANAPLRYVYDGGFLMRNYFTPDGLEQFGTLFSGGNTLRCQFLTALGHTFCIAGDKKIKDAGNIQSPININIPFTPNLVVNEPMVLPLDNKDADGFYTNWVGDEVGVFDNTSTFIQVGSNPSTVRSSIHTTFDIPRNFTDLGGVNNDTPNDVIRFDFVCDNPSEINWIRLEFQSGDEAGNYFWHEWDNGSTEGPYKMFTTGPGVLTQVEVKRSEFWPTRGDNTRWTNITAVRLIIGARSVINVTFSNLVMQGGVTGNLVGPLEYVAVAVNKNQNFVSLSKHSSINTVHVTNSSVTVIPTGNIDPNANEYWVFRRSPYTDGEFLLVHTEVGTPGFIPSVFIDSKSDEDALIEASLSTINTLQLYREDLTDDIRGMIYFRDRVIYLTTRGFYPSYKLDPSSRDARFYYELASDVNEICLFIAKVDVGNFIIATTKDFYRVSGTFNDITDEDITIQDINIYPLGCHDPAISYAFTEVSGGIMYLSATGVRIIYNATSTLVNGELDLLFKKEARYGTQWVNIIGGDAMHTAVVSQGNRIYWSFGLIGDEQVIFVLTREGDSSYWRQINLFTNTPKALCREEDGTILAVGLGPLYALEDEENGLTPINLKTRVNFGGKINNRKDVDTFEIGINTGNMPLQLEISGYRRDGTFSYYYDTLQTDHYEIVNLDLKEQIDPVLGFSIEILGDVRNFELKYFTIKYEVRPTPIKRMLMYGQDFGKANRKQVTFWPLRVDSLGSQIELKVRADMQQLDTQYVSTTNSEIVGWFGRNAPYANIWELELISDNEFELFEILTPVFSEVCPDPVTSFIFPASNFGNPGRKALTTWPITINSRGIPVTVTVYGDGIDMGAQSFVSHEPDTFFWVSNKPDLCVDWSMEVKAVPFVDPFGYERYIPFEVYNIGNPIWSETRPSRVHRVFLASNFKIDGRKNINTIPFRADLLGGPVTVRVKADHNSFAEQIIIGSGITTLEWINSESLLAVDWEIEIDGGSRYFEFFEFYEPSIIQQTPGKTYRAIFPSNNFGRANKKKLATWPFVANLLGNKASLVIKRDNTVLDIHEFQSGDEIKTQFWYNNTDTFGVDYSAELISQDGFEFYRFMNPEILEVLPMGKTFDQLGPVEFNAKGLVYEIRLRMLTEGDVVHYLVYASDELIHTGQIQTIPWKDVVYLEKFPKGVDPTICRVVLTAAEPFYRFDCEFKIRMLGKTQTTEARHVKVK